MIRLIAFLVAAVVTATTTVAQIGPLPGTGPLPFRVSQTTTGTNFSLTFNGSTQYLTTTGSTSANQQKFTFSTWFKRDATSGPFGDALISFDFGGTANFLNILFNSQDRIQIISTISGLSVMSVITSNIYNDLNVWHHLDEAIDTTQAVASNRVQLYVDGTQITAFTTATYPNLNTNLTPLATTSPVYLGVNFSLNAFFSGKLAQTYYIDGQQLAPSSFITDAPGVPKTYSGSYTGAFDFFLPYSDGSSVANLGRDFSGEGHNFSPQNMTLSNQSTDFP